MSVFFEGRVRVRVRVRVKIEAHSPHELLYDFEGMISSFWICVFWFPCMLISIWVLHV